MVGDDVFAVLEAELAAGPPDAHWVGYFGYAARPDLPGAARTRTCPTRCGCGPATLRFFDHEAGSDGSRAAGASACRAELRRRAGS